MMTNRQRGIAALELALILPLLLAVFFAITEFGRAIYTYNALTKSARVATRYLTTQVAGNPAAIATAQNLAVHGNPNGAGAPLLPGLTPGLVTVCDAASCASTHHSQGTNPAINTVSVTISGYTFTPMLDLLAFTRDYTKGGDTILSIPFGNISVTMRQS